MKGNLPHAQHAPSRPFPLELPVVLLLFVPPHPSMLCLPCAASVSHFALRLPPACHLLSCSLSQAHLSAPSSLVPFCAAASQAADTAAHSCLHSTAAKYCSCELTAGSSLGGRQQPATPSALQVFGGTGQRRRLPTEAGQKAAAAHIAYRSRLQVRWRLPAAKFCRLQAAPTRPTTQLPHCGSSDHPSAVHGCSHVPR